jgi:uncharacterized protein YaaR (DUF327 family)
MMMKMKAKGSAMMYSKTTEELLEIYHKALSRYIKTRMTSEKSHIEDFAVEVSSFSECFYFTVEAMTEG